MAPIATGFSKCGNCIFWDAESISVHSQEPYFIQYCYERQMGFCRAVSPKAGFPPWPITQMKDWCLTHEEKKFGLDKAEDLRTGQSLDLRKLDALFAAVNKMVAHCPTCDGKGARYIMTEHDGVSHPGGQSPCPTCSELRTVMNVLRGS